MKKWQTLLFSITTIANNAFASMQVVDKVVAIVNNDVILESDVNNLMRSIKKNEKENQQFFEYDIFRSNILERLIMNQIIFQISQKMNIKISKKKLDQAINDIAKKHNITLLQMKKFLTYNGINYFFYRDQIHKEMLLSEVLNKEIPHRIHILPQEVKELAKKINNQENNINKANFSYIFIPISKNSSSKQIQKAEKQANLIVKQANNYSNFKKLAISYSNNKKILKSGKMEWKDIKQMPYFFIKKLSIAKKGDIIGPIHSKDGFYIFKINKLGNKKKNISTIQVHICHILLKTSSILTDNQAKKKLEQIANDINHKKISFSSAAAKFSQDLNSANQGGNLGWKKIKLYDSSLQDVIKKLNRGQTSKPIHSPSGWHLIKLLDITTVNKINLEKKNQAYRILFNHKFAQEAEIWMQEKRACAYVKIMRN